MSETPQTKPANPITAYVSAFGPYAFGVASLLLIWFTIVRPELATRSLDLSKVQQITDTQNRTATILDAAVRRLEIVADRMENSRQ